jgi:ketosteroid isomerase-like protein
MKVQRHLTLGLASAVLMMACAQSAPKTEDAASAAEAASLDVGTLRAEVNQFVAAWNTGNQAALGPMIAEDAVLLQPDGPPIEGQAAILATMAEGYDIAMYQQAATVDEVMAVGDAAYARGTWMLNPTAAAGADAAALSGKWSALYKAGPDGTWQTWRWMWNQPSPEVMDVGE